MKLRSLPGLYYRSPWYWGGCLTGVLLFVLCFPLTGFMLWRVVLPFAQRGDTYLHEAEQNGRTLSVLIDPQTRGNPKSVYIVSSSAPLPVITKKLAPPQIDRAKRRFTWDGASGPLLAFFDYGSADPTQFSGSDPVALVDFSSKYYGDPADVRIKVEAVRRQGAWPANTRLYFILECDNGRFSHAEVRP
jgi:hypothetical protein